MGPVAAVAVLRAGVIVIEFFPVVITFILGEE